MKCKGAALLGVAVVLRARTVMADTALPASTASAVDVYMPACTGGPFDEARLLSLLRVELGAIGVSDVRTKGQGRPSPPLPADSIAAVELSVSACETASDVTIQVVDRATSKIVERTMAIGDVDFDERPRALAIAIAELLQASWAELELGGSPSPALEVPPEIRAAVVQRLTPPPLPAPVVAPAGAPRKSGATPKASHLFLDAAALARAFPSRDTALLGGAVSVSLPVERSWAAHAAVDAGYGDSHVASGTVGITAVTASAGIAAVAGHATTLEVGPVIHAGYVWAHGSAGSATTLGRDYSHIVALAGVSATLRVPARGFSALAGFDVGGVLEQASFLADTTRVAGFGGVSLGLRLGAAFGL